MKPKTIIVTQARVGSSRFPEKVLQEIGDETLLSLHLKRLKKSDLADKIIVATTFEPKSSEIMEIAQKVEVSVFQGSTNDVLDRFYNAVKNEEPEYVVRVTSDCPLIDAVLIDDVIKMVVGNDLDYGSNTLKEEYPDGQDIEVFKFNALETAWKEATLASDREHVTPYIKKKSTYHQGHVFKSVNYDAPANMNHLRMTVDEPVDLETIKILVDKLGVDASWESYADLLIKSSDLFLNQGIIRNEGYLNSIKKEL